MIVELNGLKLTNRKYEIDSCDGYFKKQKRGVLISDKNRDPVAFLVTDTTPFIVTAHSLNGKTYYMNACTSKTEDFLGIKGLSYRQENEVAEKMARNFDIQFNGRA